MNKIITLFAILVCGIQFSNASTALSVNTILDTTVTAVFESDDLTEDRFYFWKVENAHGSASGYSMTLEKAESMIKKVSEGDYSISVIIMSDPR
jgi:phosphodiesterase/alkaline phosphatase D-like protein